LILLLISLLLLSSSELLAGSCCGGGGTGVDIMLGDTKSVFRTKYSDETILADTNNKFINYRVQDEVESIRSLNLSYSYRLSELTQLGINIPVIEKTRQINNERKSLSGIGDPSINYAYEFLPEYTRNPYISQAFIFSQLSIPSSPSIFTTKRTDTLDTRGSGHEKYTIGTIFTKRKNWGMTTFQSTISYRPGKKFDNSQLSNQNIQTKDSLDYSLAINQSYDLSDQLAVNIGVSKSYIGNKTTSVFKGNRQSSFKTPFTTSIDYSKDDLTILLSYTDDFVIGDSTNSTLSKTVTIGLIRRVNL
jgi:hypothetical protein